MYAVERKKLMITKEVNYLPNGEVWENIPILKDGVWGLKSYNNKQEFIEDLEQNYFKEVGEYGFNEYSDQVRDAQRFKLKNGEYCLDPYMSKGFIKFWDDEKEKCRKGVFYQNGNKAWYFSRDIYFWINYLPIYHKKLKRDEFPNLTDAHVYMDLYEFIAELRGEHAIGTKKRQFGSSYYHGAKLTNRLWFEPNTILKMGASLDKYLNGKEGIWRYIRSYRSRLNKHTAWYRGIEGGESGPWQQMLKKIDPVTKREEESGRMGILASTSLERSATNGVGGATDIFYHEEAGIAPKLDETYDFMLSAVEEGDQSTGQFIAFGSVGDLSQCDPLKEFMYKPTENGFYGVRNKYADPSGLVIVTGCFISEAFAYPGFMDEFGNSDVEGALAHLSNLKAEWSSKLTAKSYALRCSQKPSYLNEAFKFRGESEFPIQELESEDYRLSQAKNFQILDLEYDLDDETYKTIKSKPSKRIPITDFPINPKMEDKRGAIVVYEKPILGLQPLVTYYASVDPVGQGKTITSKSLASVYVYRRMQLVKRTVDGSVVSTQEGDKIVCSWAGRYDDIDDTHEEIIKIILWYKAWTLVENNIDLLIGEMKRRNLQMFLVPSSQFKFGKEFQSYETSKQYDYGWRNVTGTFDKLLKNYLFKFLTEIVHEELNESGEVVKVIRGVSRINDRMAIKEMIAYYTGLNVDRIITLAALSAFISIQDSHRRGNITEIVQDEETQNLENSQNLVKLNRGPFTKMGNPLQSSVNVRMNKNPFKKIR